MSISPEKFAKQVKEKYPQYADLDSLELTTKILQRYPQYASQIDVNFNPDTGEVDRKFWSNAIKNIVPSTGQFFKDITTPILHPIKTVEAIGTIGAGLLEKTVGAGVRAITGAEQTEFGVRSEETVESVFDFYKDRYGSIEAAKETFASDPVGFTADVATLLTGAGATVKGAGVAGRLPTVAKAGAAIQRTGMAIEPINIAAKTVASVARPTTRAIGAVTTPILGTSTGTGSDVVRSAFRNPTQEFTQALRGITSEQDILSSSRDALFTIKENRGKAYRTQLTKLKESTQELNFNPVNDKVDGLLKQFNIVSDDLGQLDFSRSTIADSTEAARIAQIVDTVKDWGSQKGDLTPLGFDTLKQRLDDFYSPSRKAQLFVTNLKNAVKSEIIKEVPEYAKMVKDYENASNLITDIEGSLSLRTTAATETALKKLTSALKENNQFKQTLIQELDAVSKGKLSEQITGVALSQAAPRGLARSVASAEAFLAIMSGNPQFLSVLAISSPRLVGEFLRGMGLASKEVKKVIKFIQENKDTLIKSSRTLFQAGRITEEV